MAKKRFVLLAAVYCVLGLTAHGTGVFEALETTPGELGRSAIPVNVEALALLPLSEVERRELLAAWLECGRAEAIVLASRWLEFTGQPDAALKVLDERPELEVDPLQRTRLLYCNGREAAAAAAFAECQQVIPCGPFDAYAPPRLEALLRPLVAQAKWDETAAFLAWLQPRCTLSEWRSSVLTSRIDLALQQGAVPDLLDRLAAESAVGRVIASRFLDPGGDRQLPVPAAGSSVADIAWRLDVEPCTAELARAVETAIRSGAGSPAERRELFRQLARYFRGTGPGERMLETWLRTREQEFIGHYTALGTYGIGDLPAAPLCELADRHPSNGFLNYLAGCNGNYYNPEKITGPARTCLWRALDRNPLVARPLEAGQDPFHRLDDYYRHSAASDPARFALAALSARCDEELLYRHLTGKPEFGGLSAADRLRYLLVAGLEVPAWELLQQLDWNQPANDPLGGALTSLVTTGMGPLLRRPSEETWAAMVKVWPRMLLGSPTKSAARVAAHSDVLLQRFGGAGALGKGGFHQEWMRGVRSRGDRFTQDVLRDCRWLLSDDNNAKATRELLGIPADDPLVAAAGARRALSGRLEALGWFVGPGISGFPAGYGHDDGHRFVCEEVGLGWFRDQPGRHKELLWLSHRYPGLRQLSEVYYWGAPPEDACATALRLRELLPAQCAQAVALDLAIERKLLIAPAAAVDRAARHINGLLAQRKEPEFVLFRASDGVAMRHGDRPRNPEALLELAELADTRLPVRRAAADLLAAGQANFPQERSAELQPVREALRTAGSKPTRWPQPSNGEPIRRNPPRLDAAGADVTIAWARAVLAECPDDVEAAVFLARGLAVRGEAAEFIATLGLLRKLDAGCFLTVISEPAALARLTGPGLADLAALLDLPENPAGSDTSNRQLPIYVLRSMHQTFLKQDPALAATFRGLLIRQQWRPFLTEDLARAGRGAEAADWLAAVLTAEPPPVAGGGSARRFPRVAAPSGAAGCGPDALLDGLEVHTILQHQLSGALIEKLQHGTAPNRQLPLAYVQLLADPTVATYQASFGPLLADRNAAEGAALKRRLIDWLRRHESTKPLAATLAAQSSP